MNLYYTFIYLIQLGTRCLYAPQPPTGSNIVLSLDKESAEIQKGKMRGIDDDKGIVKNVYDINSTVFYKCPSKTKFSRNYAQETVQATCLAENQWKVPDFWDRCVACTFLTLYYYSNKG